ncbi:phosphopantetheine adenylyltransferase [Tsukamurella sputi]|uniref:Phosphopantetheine adenylyltransferase n=1 Tax=Tsukamurella sputi TaxID=2591848 RepID=A0A5C5RTM0_9ACTN|nr:phosphopantetheine adenylyltransferase [Tsukamurella sputi]TWS25952.1 phosphopantetheine adenylyltransferase [Tsukamurella sputi]
MNTHRPERALLAAVGVAHLLPATVAFSRTGVERAYGVTVADDDTELLLRHRATFFGLLGAALLAGAVDDRYRKPAIAMGSVSVGSFLLLAQAGDLSAELQRVRRIDIALLGALAAASAGEVAALCRRRRPGRRRRAAE